jgi:hypothetical protein
MRTAVFLCKTWKPIYSRSNLRGGGPMADVRAIIPTNHRKPPRPLDTPNGMT